MVTLKRGLEAYQPDVGLDESLLRAMNREHIHAADVKATGRILSGAVGCFNGA